MTSGRPLANDRRFRSPALESILEHVAEQIAAPQLRRLFENCLPNTLDTAVYFRTDEQGQPDTYIVTGDIPAMWLRDSTGQIWPYLRFAGQDTALQQLCAGLIRRQTAYLLLDPYANAFIDPDIGGTDHDPGRPEGNAWQPGVWERKYELDSLCAPLRLAAAYYSITHDLSVFDTAWTRAIEAVLAVMEHEQATVSHASLPQLFRFTDRDGQAHPAIRVQGYGYPGRACGLVRTVFRPSDDEAVFPYNIPANALAATSLRGIAPILKQLGQTKLKQTALNLARAIHTGIQAHGIVPHPDLGRIFAYEVDGFGSACLMDDPNPPNLLSLPYIGYTRPKDQIYAATRQFALSPANPFYVQGKTTAGLSSPHTGTFDHIWPLATIMQALTSTSQTEITDCLQQLAAAAADTNFMHESWAVDDPASYTRPWFAWANSLFGELILQLAERHPQLLSRA